MFLKEMLLDYVCIFVNTVTYNLSFPVFNLVVLDLNVLSVRQIQMNWTCHNKAFAGDRTLSQ